MTEHNETNAGVDRRTAIKKAVAGAAVAGVVWSAPRVEGLSLRPNYASAASPGPGTASATFQLQNGRQGASVPCGGGSAGTFEFAGRWRPAAPNSVDANDPPLRGMAYTGNATGNVNAVNVSPGPWTVAFFTQNTFKLTGGSASAPSPTVTIAFDCL